MKVEVLFYYSIFETRGLVNLERLYGEDLALSSWWSSLAEKLDVSRRMDLVEYMATYAKREMSSNTLGMPFTYLYLS